MSHVTLSFLSGGFTPKNTKFSFLLLKRIWKINFGPQEREISMTFNILLCWVINLEKEEKRTKLLAKSKQLTLTFEANILLKIFYHCGAVALAIHFVLLLGTRLEKWHQLLIALSMDLTYFYNIKLVFQLNKFQICSIFNMFTKTNTNAAYLWPTPSQGLSYFSVNI